MRFKRLAVVAIILSTYLSISGCSTKPIASPLPPVNIVSVEPYEPCEGVQVQTNAEVLGSYKKAFEAVSEAYMATMYNIAECNIRNQAEQNHSDRLEKIYKGKSQ